MKIRLKILSGFLLLVGMLIIAGVLGIIEFKRLSRSFESLLSDNYKSIDACMAMLEALEREDSGILLFLMDQHEEGRRIIDSGDSLMNESLHIAKNNITETNEDEFIENIQKEYSDFKATWNELILNPDIEDEKRWYFGSVHTKFVETKIKVKELLKLNQDKMFRESFQLSEKSQRAVMPGVVAIVAALIFAFLFNFFINYYFVSPLMRIIKKIQYFTSQDSNFDAQIETNDELKKLEDSIRNLVYKLKKH